MSFLSILTAIGRGVKAFGEIGGKVLQAATPVVAALDPPAGAILNQVTSAVAALELLIPGDKQGDVKKVAVTDIAHAQIPKLPEVVEKFGEGVQVDPQKLSTVIDATVALYNAIQQLTDSLKKP